MWLVFFFIRRRHLKNFFFLHKLNRPVRMLLSILIFLFSFGLSRIDLLFFSFLGFSYVLCIFLFKFPLFCCIFFNIVFLIVCSFFGFICFHFRLVFFFIILVYIYSINLHRFDCIHIPYCYKLSSLSVF